MTEGTGGRPGAGGGWLERLEKDPPRPPAARERLGKGVAPDDGNGEAVATPARKPPRPVGERADGARAEPPDATEAAVERLREEALRAAREDAAAGLPRTGDGGASGSEVMLRERCRAFYERWSLKRRREMARRVSDAEADISNRLGVAALAVDRFERLTNELVRLRTRVSRRRSEVNAELQSNPGDGPRGLSTRVYVAAISFLGVVEFFANAPVFGALLPRDALTERQIRLVSETAQGWFAGAERVLAHLVLRPDAALLAAGVVTFLCVLAHFFGHSLREQVSQRDRHPRRHTVSDRSPLENIVPMVISGLGLLLVIGVLYELRLRLGAMGEMEFQTDMTAVEELRRQAGWLRADGDLLGANELTNRSDDMEAAATNLRDYARSMSGLSFPILLLNSTLVLCAISAAYFHRRPGHREYFDEDPFEADRKTLVEAAEEVASGLPGLLSELLRRIRELRGLLAEAAASADRRGMVHQLESVVALYRAENGRLRGLEPSALAAFVEPARLDVTPEPEESALLAARDPGEYEREREALKDRFEAARKRFNEEATAW